MKVKQEIVHIHKIINVTFLQQMQQIYNLHNQQKK